MKRSLLCVALAVLAAAFLFLPDANSQQRRRTSRRTTSPARPQPVETPATTGEPSVVSTADEQPEAQPRRTTTARTRQQTQTQSVQAENERLHSTVRALSSQVEQLSGQLKQMKTDQLAMYDLERLTRAEQHSEELRRQLREVTDKEFELQERLAEIDYESQPDSIQRRAALVGSLNPGAVRDAIAQQLERERTRIRKQLELLGTSHTRLEASVATADAEVERLRQRVEAADQAQQSAPTPGTTPADANANANATPQPSPSPSPAQPPR
jgi:predicted RNase H-like nuclease (RuvC/YqgF family)